MIPSQVTIFRFPGFGPDLSHGLAALTQDGRVVLADAAGNPGTSVTNAIEIAVPVALEALDVDPEGQVYLWTPNDPLEPGSLWMVDLTVTGDGEPSWTAVDWESDEELRGAVAALERARGES